MPEQEPLDNLAPAQVAKDLSVQDRNITNSGLWSIGGETQRNPLLPAYGTKRRDEELLRIFRDDMNTMFKGVVAGIVKKIQSTPFEVRAPKVYGTYWQRMLSDADLGAGWATFIGKLVLDFMRYDGGAFIELIGSGDPSEPLVTAPVAIANLDSLRCWITGDDEYPIWYYSADGHVYKMHYTRVAQMVDTPESDERRRGYGYCALSRAVTTVTKDILMNRYVVQLLDDKPIPGFMLVSNVGEQGLQSAVNKLNAERETDSGGVWGRTVRLFGLNQEVMPDIKFVTYTQAPPNFDYPTYQNQLAKEMANAMGVDLNEFWELSGGNIGSATQSEIMSQKSRGKTIGNLYKQLERLINSILPNSCEFVFEYDDPQRDSEIANNASAWVVITASLSDVLSADERRRLLANQIPAIADVITDEDGVIQDQNDTDIQTEQEQIARTPDTYASPVSEADTAMMDDIEKSIASTSRKFISRVEFNMRKFMNNTISRFMAREMMKTILLAQGREAYQDGKRVAKADPRISPDDEITIMQWMNKQYPFIDKFLGEIVDGKITRETLRYHAELWTNKSLKEIYNEGLLQGDNNKFYMWVYHPNADHCTTCIKANGQIHRLKTWRKSGIMPQASVLECGGYNCKCRLVPVENASQFAKGDLRSVKRTLKEHRHTPPNLTFITPPADTTSALSALDRLLEGFR